MRRLFHPDAREEFHEAARYYKAISPRLGRRFSDAVSGTLQRIIINPTMFRIVEKDVRKCRVPRFPYGVLYQIKGDHVWIVAVMNLKRHPDYWKNRL